MPDYTIDFGITNVDSKYANACVPTVSSEIEIKRSGARSYEYFAEKSGYVEDLGAKFSKESYETYMYNMHNDMETFCRSDIPNLFNADYMQNAANNGEIFSVHFKGKVPHVDNARYLKVYINAPEKNTLTFKHGSYNFNRTNYSKKGILNVFHLF